MTGEPEYPLVDGRRLSELRQVLLRDIAALAPDWRGVQETQGSDRALVEIAARLSEEATKRLDKTPERDALAFLEMFDVAPPRPGAARGVSVFALKEDKTKPVQARARTGIEIETLAGESANFETTEDLRIQPARIGRLATVDPAADVLEVAPDQATSLEPDLTPRPEYELAASAGPEATVISIDPPVGILPGDLLRVTLIGGSDPLFLEIVEFSEDGLATLKAPVGGAGLSRDQVKKIERMTWLDAFAMPNRQEHGLYIGDKDVLNVKEPAEITLRFKPGSISGILSPNAVEFEIWGTKEGPGKPEETPRWHRLVRLAGAGTDLRLYKLWIGPVDKLKLGEDKKESRWIRIRPHDPIVPEDGAHPLTGEKGALDQVTMGITTKEPKDGSGDTVSQAAYNGTPLPVTSAFLPFGSEPRRFDTFALAAPEAFTKPGAVATLNFSLMDATLAAVTMAIRSDAERHLYGIGRNGRLQVLDLTEERQLWREFDGPPDEGSEVILALDPLSGVQAYGLLSGYANYTNPEKAPDIVVARTTTGRLVSASVEILRDPQASAEEAVTVSTWALLPDLPTGMTAEGEIPAIAVGPVDATYPYEEYFGFLTVAASGGVQHLWLDDSGKPAAYTSTWTNIPTDSGGPILPRNPVLAQVEESAPGDDVELLTTDQDGSLWALRIALFGGAPQWFSLEDDGNAPILLEPGARPAGLKVDLGEGPRLLVTGVAADGDLHLWEFEYDVGIPTTVSAQSWSKTVPGLFARAVLRMVRGLTEGSAEPPHVLGYQNAPDTGLVFEWAPETGQVASHVPGLEMMLSNTPLLSSAAIFAPTVLEPQALLAFGADDQILVRVRITPSVQISAQDDWIAAPPSTQSDAGLYDLILVERLQAGQSAREIDEISVFDTNDAGDDVIRLTAGTTDWDEPVRVFRAKSSTVPASFDPDLGSGDVGFGTLQGGPDSTSEIPDRRLLVVRPTDRPDEYGIFAVAGTADGDKLTVTEPDDLSALMDGHEEATWQEIDEVGGANAGTAVRFIGTLVEIEPVAAGLDPSEPNRLCLFGSPGRAVAAEVLSSLDQARTLVLQGWGGPPPHVGELVKIVTEGTSAEVLEAQSLSSDFSAPELSWEYFNREGWKLLDKAFHDTTAGFSRSGEVSFIVPRDLAPTEIGGQEDYWIRVRLVGGDYGKPIYKVITTNSPGSNASEQKVVVDTDDLRPPEVASVTAELSLPPEHLPSLVVARNNLRDLDQTSANRLSGAQFAMFEDAFVTPLGTGGSRAIMLGMTRPLETGSASLFVQVREQDRAAKLILETLGPENTWSPAPLRGEDPTKGLHRTGLLRFNVTGRPAQVLLFGKALHWLRMRVEDLGDWAPEITGIWLNGVQILQAETIRQELLTSSAGEPNLELQLLKQPVLPNSLELRVRERLSAEETAASNAARREGEPAPVLEKVPNLPGKWVLWRQVDSLLDQPADARVYLLSTDGRLRFGDDRNGRIPPAGRDNIRAFSYQTGGQRVETTGFAEAGLRGSVEGVEMVLAPAPIAGGTHPPSSSELVARMPEALRHAGQGLSLSDLEALARDADSEIAQVRAFAPAIPGGPVRLIVLAQGANENRMPEYSLAQQDNLRRLLHAKMSDAYGPACLEVRSADFVAVKVTVSLVARPGALAALETDAGAHLRTFLHTALGGPAWNGWPPGRSLWPTDIRRVLAELETLDRVVNVEILLPEGRNLGDVQPHEVIATASVRDVTVLVEGEAEA